MKTTTPPQNHPEPGFRAFWGSLRNCNQVVAQNGYEGVPMPFTAEQFYREVYSDIVKKMSREQRAEFFKDIPLEKLLEGLTVDDLLKGLSPETRAELVKRIKD